MIELIDLIRYLRPNEPFVLDGNDLSGLTFDNFVQEILPEELENAKILLEKEQKEIKEQKENIKAAAEAKLAALGLTINDLKALGIN